MNWIKAAINNRVLSVLFQGFASGLPLALTSSTLQAWYTKAGVGLMAIGSLTLIGLPYAWKFVWAPFMDRFELPGGRRKGWILCLQLLIIISILLLAQFDPSQHPVFMGSIAVFIAFLSASQDIVIDAYRSDILTTEERGIGAALTIFAFRIAMILSGGMALILADHIGWKLTYECMAILLFIPMVVTLFAPEPLDGHTYKNEKPTAFFINPFKNLWRRENITIILLFVFFYKFGDAFAMSLMSNFLLRGLQFSLTDVGIAFKTFGVIATILGAFIGGSLMVSLTLYQSLFYFGIAQAFSNLMFVLLAYVGKSYGVMVSALFVESFCSGLSTAAFMAFLMSLCDRHFSATQYASLSALSSLGRVILGPFTAMIVQHIGWINFYWWSFFLSIPGIILLTLLRNQVRVNEEVVEF